MSKKIIGILVGAVLLVGIVALVVILLMRPGANQNDSAQQVIPGDAQKLLIPRWFLRSLILDGQKAALAEDQQQITLQFKADGTANGTGGCNSFSTTYQAGQNNRLAFGPIVQTEMACASGMQEEQAYFQALAKVQQFQVRGAQLTLSSPDGKTVLVFAMPPK